jgi:D-cysteine desulfhydrase family pyridoxal phosphate-dependent enzyme
VRPALSPSELALALARQPRVSLGLRPTPLHRVPSFSKALGADVWLKRDDLNAVATGGNKVRKLEFLLGEAARIGADTLVTVGAPQSNHARTVAAAAAMHGLDCHLVLGGNRPSAPTGSLVADLMLGARLHFAGRDDWDVLESRSDALAGKLRSEGRRPFVMPIGGSTRIGALGFVGAFLELLEQIPAVELVRCTLVHASSSGGTQAGLELGRQLLGLPGPRIVGVAVAKTAGDLRTEIHELMKQTAQLLGFDRALSAPYLVDGFIGSGYAIPTPGGRAAMSLLARSEGILSDPVYTAKALDAVVKLASAHELDQGPVVFWHTGGLAALFAEDQGLMRWSAWRNLVISDHPRRSSRASARRSGRAPLR